MRKHLALVALLALSLTACSGPGDKNTSSAPPVTPTVAASANLKSLSSWKGEWNNIARYLDDPALAPGYAAAAKKKNTTPEKEKTDLKKRREANFGGLVIEGDKITFYDGFVSKGGKPISSSKYTFDKTYESTVGGKKRTWYAFKATASDAKYPTMMFFPINREESLLHFHMRYGKTPEELLAKDGWFPTVVAPATTVAQLITEISE